MGIKRNPMVRVGGRPACLVWMAHFKWTEYFDTVLNLPPSINDEAIQCLPQVPVNQELVIVRMPCPHPKAGEHFPVHVGAIQVSYFGTSKMPSLHTFIKRKEIANPVKPPGHVAPYRAPGQESSSTTSSSTSKMEILQRVSEASTLKEERRWTIFIARQLQEKCLGAKQGPLHHLC